MNQKEIEACKRFINEPITADNLELAVPTFPESDTCSSYINQYKCQLPKGHTGTCEDKRPVAEIAAELGASGENTNGKQL